MQIAERVARPLGLARWDLLVVRSPGTPAAGLLLLAGQRLTGRTDYLDAARRAGDLLVATQLPSGGWFSEMPVEGGGLAAWFPWVATPGRRSTTTSRRVPCASRSRSGSARVTIASGTQPGAASISGMELAVLEPPAISPCAGTPMEVVAADGLR
jgi:hypothetical protein